jgi:hypothetical protein
LRHLLVARLEGRVPTNLQTHSSMRIALQNQRDDFLSFAGSLDAKPANIAQAHESADPLVREACVLSRLPSTSTAH